MAQNRYRLSDSVIVEPLINNWAIWSDLISPVTYSMHLAHYQIKLLESYLANLDLHVKASNNPKFIGGRFVAVAPERADEVQQLLEKTRRNQSDNIELAQAVTEFYGYLSDEAKGQSLEPFYERLPEQLRGCVELVYDYYHHPIIRFIESLLYESRYYKKELQSLRISTHARDNGRPFFLNTPRLPCDDQIDWVTSFESQQLSGLFDLEFNTAPLGEIREMLGLSSSEDHLLRPFLSDQNVQPARKWDEQGIRLRYLGHACVLVEYNGVSILTDPFIGVKAENGGIDRFTYKDLPEKIDFAIITHGHHDHFVPESLLRLRNRIQCLVVPKSFGIFYADTSLKLMAAKLGFKNVVELDSLDSIKIPDGEIISIPFLGEHADLAHGKTAYAIRAGMEQILFAADSNCLDKSVYQKIRSLLGPIETVFLGMECDGAPLSWLYGALLPSKLQHNHDQSRRTKGCDSAAAMDLLETVGARRVYVYAMGSEPWLQFSLGLGLSEGSIQMKESNRLLACARDKGFLVAERPFGKLETYLNCKTSVGVGS